MCFPWGGQERRTVRRENESQTFNCVSGGKFQDFGYLMKILSLGSFPMWCQNGRRVNVWTVYWRPTLTLCVCVRVCELRFQGDCFHIEATLTSTSKCLLWPIHVQVPENKRWHRLYSLAACYCLSWGERGQPARKKSRRAPGRKVWRCEQSIKRILGKFLFFCPTTPTDAVHHESGWRREKARNSGPCKVCMGPSLQPQPSE